MKEDKPIHEALIQLIEKRNNMNRRDFIKELCNILGTSSLLLAIAGCRHYQIAPRAKDDRMRSIVTEWNNGWDYYKAGPEGSANAVIAVKKGYNLEGDYKSAWKQIQDKRSLEDALDEVRVEGITSEQGTHSVVISDKNGNIVAVMKTISDQPQYSIEGNTLTVVTPEADAGGPGGGAGGAGGGGPGGS